MVSKGFLSLITLLCLTGVALSQQSYERQPYVFGPSQTSPDRDQYLVGPNERFLIPVHIWGEVKQPGEYLVADDTDILELISKAGGPTDLSDLEDIKITRGLITYNEIREFQDASISTVAQRREVLNNYKKKIIKIDLDQVLNDENAHSLLPTLQPGDVIKIGRNNWHTWQGVIRVVSQVAIVVQMYYWWSRIENQ